MSTPFRSSNELSIPFDRMIDIKKTLLALLNDKNTNILASKISSGLVNDRQFNYLSGTTSNIQNQIDQCLTETSVNRLSNKTIIHDDNEIIDIAKTTVYRNDPNSLVDDTTNNYNYGSFIVNEKTYSPFICADPKIESAVWINVFERIISFPTITSDSETYTTAVKWIAGNKPHNFFDIAAIANRRDCFVRIFNETTRKVLVTSDTIPNNRVLVSLISPSMYYKKGTLLSLQVINGTVEAMTVR